MKNNKIALIVLGIVVIASLGWGLFQNNARAAVTDSLEYSYQRSFYDLIASTENLAVLTTKGQVTASDEQLLQIISDIRRQAESASAALSALPLQHETLTRTQRFLNQLSDYGASLFRQTLDGEKLTAKDKNTMQELGTQMQSLAADLRELQQEIADNDLRFYMKTSKNIVADTEDVVGSGFSSLNDACLEYPTLIYDGPFSDHMESRKARGLTGAIQNSQEGLNRAREIVQLLPSAATHATNSTAQQAFAPTPERANQPSDALLHTVANRAASADNLPDSQRHALPAAGEMTDTLAYLGETSDEAAIPVYCYGQKIGATPNGKNKDAAELHLDISKTGGHLILLNNSRLPVGSQLSDEEGRAKATAFLQALGYENMQPTYATTQDNTLTLAFVAKMGNVLLYPDQIKVQVALDNGEIIGFTAGQYFMSHSPRQLPKVKVSAREARDEVSDNLKIESQRLALIPSPSGTEVLCYEFQGSYNDTTYLVYINAITENEEQILEVIDTPNGRFTM